MDTRGEKSDMQRKPQQEENQPSRLKDMLDPDHMAGQNIGAPPTERELMVPTAYDRKELHQRLRDDFTDDELKQIPVLQEGSRLEQGATYIDLAEGTPRELTATAGMTAEARNCYVPKNRVPYDLWNRLIGEEKR